MSAIINAVEFVYRNSFEFVKSEIEAKGISFIQTFPYMGKATSFHLAKNIGLNVVKPDRHLLRISTILGFKDPHDLCMQISNTIEEKLSIIDLVMWRYATLDKDYILKLKRYFKCSEA